MEFSQPILFDLQSSISKLIRQYISPYIGNGMKRCIGAQIQNYYMALSSPPTDSKLIQLLLLMILVQCTLTIGSLTLSLTSPTINANSIYQFQIVDPSLLSSDGEISIIFPAALFTITSVSCYNTDDNTQIFTHTLPNPNTVNIVYTRASVPNQIFRVSIDSITNPSSQQSVQFGYTFSSGGAQINSINQNQNPYIPGLLQSCTLSFAPSVTHTETVATLAITVGNGLPQDSSLTLTFPTTWENSVSATYKPVMYSTTVCSKVSGASLAASFSCSILNGALTSSIGMDAAFGSAIATGQSFELSLTGIRSPPTTSPNNQITVTTEEALSGNIVDSSSCTVQAVSAKVMSLNTNDAFTVGVQAFLAIHWTTTEPIIVGDIITVTLPTDYMIFVNTNNVVIFFDGSVANVGVTSGATVNEKIFTIASLQSATEIPDGATMNLTGLYINNLIDSSSRNVQLVLSRNGYNIGSGTLAIAPSPNALTSPSISSDLTGVSNSIAMDISFTVTSPLLIDSLISITFPSTMLIISSAPTCQLSSSNYPNLIVPAPTCAISGSQLTVNSFLASQLPTGASLTLTVQNLLANPTTTQPTAVFVMSTKSNAGHAIDQDTTQTYTATSQTIGSLTIVPAGLMVASSQQYTITYTIINTLRTGSRIQITIPAEVALAASPSYKYTIDGGTQLSTSPTLVGNLLTFTDIVASQLAPNQVIVIKISTIRNPLSMKPSSSFSVETYYSTYLTQSLSTGLTVTCDTFNSFDQLIPVVTDPTNGASAIYSLYFSSFVQLEVNDILRLQLLTGTNELAFTSSVTECSIRNSTSTFNNACALGPRILTVTISGTLLANQQYRLVVSSIVLARTPDPSPLFTLTSYTSQNFGISQSTLTPVTNTQPNNMVSLSMDITSPSRLNQDNSFVINIQTFNALFTGDYAVITLPSLYTYIGTPTSSLCNNTNLTCSQHQSDPLAIKVEGAFSGHTIISVSVPSGLYISPKTFSFTGSNILVNTYTSADLFIDQTDTTTTPLTFSLSCGGKCQTCLSTNTSHCSSCYQVGTGHDTTVTYDGYVYLSSDNQCLDACGQNYFNNSGICQRCQSPCLSCQLNANDCKSCVTGFFFNSGTSTCVLECPAGTYADAASNCAACSSSCLNCSGTALNCTACTGSAFLHNSQCLSTCPTGYYASANDCLQCDVSCDGCSNSDIECVSCANGYYSVPNTTRCLNNCPDGSVSDDVTGSCTCSTQCATCSGTLSNCTSCSALYLFYQNLCLVSCPGGTYLPTGGSTCLPCSDSNCIDCTETSCSKCATSYYLYSGQCIVSCPSGTIAVAKVCELCATGCSDCLTQTLCTSCYTGYLFDESTCVTSCPTNKVAFNGTSCLSDCPTGYTNTSGVCDNTTSDTTTNTTTVVTAYDKIIPFPFIISYAVIAIICIGLKCMFEHTLFVTALMCLGSLSEIGAVLTITVLSIIEYSSTQLPIGVILLLTGLGLIYLLNIANIIIVATYLQKDEKFSIIYNKTKSANIFIRIISVVFYLKFHEIVFSNLCGVKALRNKVDHTSVLFPINILLIASVFVSVLIIIGAGLLSYSVQDLLLTSAIFIQSLDCIVVVVLNIIPTVLVLRRKEKEYTEDVYDEEQKRYETHDQLKLNDEGNAGMEEVFMEESGINYANLTKSGISRKNYFYSSSKGVHNIDDPSDTPLNKKTSNLKPLGSGRDQSNQAIVGGQGSLENFNKGNGIQEEQDDLEEIMLEEPVKDNLVNVGEVGKHQSPTKKELSSNYEGYDLDPEYLEMEENSDEFKKLPAETRSKIRLAKANRSLNKNKLNRSPEDDIDIQKIQLSPKKKGDKKGKSKEKNGTGKKSAGRNSPGKLQDDESNRDSPLNAKMDKNRSEELNKNKSNEKRKSKITKSQNLKPKKNKNQEMKVVYDEKKNGTNNDENSEEFQEEQPSIPKFKSNLVKDRYKTDIDDLDDGREGAKSKGRKTKRNQTDFSGNQRMQQGNNILDGNDPDIIPHSFSTEQIKIINKKKKDSEEEHKEAPELQIIQDDESIFRKIYHEDSETLKSLQGQKTFTNEISPSQFNVQNQRFSEIEEDPDIPERPVIEMYEMKDDGFNDNPYLPRYSSNTNIDYDNVVSKRIDNERIKELEKIYLPRLEVKKPRKR